MKFSQLIEYNERNLFLTNHSETESGKLVPGLFLFFQKALYMIKVSAQQLSFNIFWWTSTWI